MLYNKRRRRARYKAGYGPAQKQHGEIRKHGAYAYHACRRHALPQIVRYGPRNAHAHG